MKKIMFSLLALMLAFNGWAQTTSEPDVHKEFMLFIYSNGDRITNLSSKKQQLHIKKIGTYIENLAKAGKLKGAQPLKMEGISIVKSHGNFMEEPLNKEMKVIAGYYHILAKDMKEAISIAKSDPRFEEDGWKVEIRQVKTVEGIN